MIKDYHYHKNKKRRYRQFYGDHTVDKVINNIIQVTESNVTLEQVKGHKRNKEIKEIRFYVYWICFYVYNMPLNFIGKNLNNRDHATIIHGRDRMEDWYDTDKDFRNKFDNVILKKFENYHSR